MHQIELQVPCWVASVFGPGGAQCSHGRGHFRFWCVRGFRFNQVNSPLGGHDKVDLEETREPKLARVAGRPPFCSVENWSSLVTSTV